MRNVQSKVIELKGGVDEHKPALQMEPGTLGTCINYIIEEGVNAGYSSIPGYERIDGTGKASDVLGTKEDHVDWQIKKDSIVAPPGQGPTLGLVLYQSKLYTFRRKVSPDTEVGMYVMGGVGGDWTEIDTTGHELDYSADGHNFQFSIYNFSADPTKENLYFCDGVQDRAREYDGIANTIDTISGPVDGGTITDSDIMDKPKFITARKMFLILGYPGGVVQHSKVGDPQGWRGDDGAGQMDFGKELTGLHIGVGDTLFIFMDREIQQMVGDFPNSYTLKLFSSESGAYPGTIQRLLGTSFFLDDRGITTLDAVDAFGDYAANAISSNFKRTLLSMRDEYSCSYAHRTLNQYRLYFNNGLGIIVSFKGKELIGATYSLYPTPVDNVVHGTFGSEVGATFFTSQATLDKDEEDIEGLVYKDESGLSFDGQKILTRGETSYYHYGSPRVWKRFISCMIEANTATPIPFSFKVDYDYGDTALPMTEWLEGSSGASGTGNSLYSFASYSTSVYGGSAVTFRQPVYLVGFGTNMSMQWTTNEAWHVPHSLQNIIVDFLPNRRRV